LSWANAGFGFVFLFALKSVLYFGGNAKGKGTLSAAAATLVFLLTIYEKRKIEKKLSLLRQSK